MDHPTKLLSWHESILHKRRRMLLRNTSQQTYACRAQSGCTRRIKLKIISERARITLLRRVLHQLNVGGVDHTPSEPRPAVLIAGSRCCISPHILLHSRSPSDLTRQWYAKRMGRAVSAAVHQLRNKGYQCHRMTMPCLSSGLSRPVCSTDNHAPLS